MSTIVSMDLEPFPSRLAPSVRFLVRRKRRRSTGKASDARGWLRALRRSHILAVASRGRWIRTCRSSRDRSGSMKLYYSNIQYQLLLAPTPPPLQHTQRPRVIKMFVVFFILRFVTQHKRRCLSCSGRIGPKRSFLLKT